MGNPATDLEHAFNEHQVGRPRPQYKVDLFGRFPLMSEVPGAIFILLQKVFSPLVMQKP
jgi:hypothetical protein